MVMITILKVTHPTHRHRRLGAPAFAILMIIIFMALSCKASCCTSSSCSTPCFAALGLRRPAPAGELARGRRPATGGALASHARPPATGGRMTAQAAAMART
jgi:hypothetical protein